MCYEGQIQPDEPETAVAEKEIDMLMLLVIATAGLLIAVLVVLLICCICRKGKDDDEEEIEEEVPDKELNIVEKQTSETPIREQMQERRQTQRPENKKSHRQSRPSVATYDPTNIDDDSLIYMSEVKGLRKKSSKGIDIELVDKEKLEDSFEP